MTIHKTSLTSPETDKMNSKLMIFVLLYYIIIDFLIQIFYLNFKDLLFQFLNCKKKMFSKLLTMLIVILISKPTKYLIFKQIKLKNV